MTALLAVLGGATVALTLCCAALRSAYRRGGHAMSRLARLGVHLILAVSGALMAVLLLPLLAAAGALLLAVRIMRPRPHPAIWVAGGGLFASDTTLLARYETEMAEFTPTYVRQLADLYLIPGEAER